MKRKSQQALLSSQKKKLLSFSRLRGQLKSIRRNSIQKKLRLPFKSGQTRWDKSNSSPERDLNEQQVESQEGRRVTKKFSTEDFDKPTRSSVNWKDFSAFANMKEQAPEEEDVVVLPQICYNKNQVEQEIKKMDNLPNPENPKTSKNVSHGESEITTISDDDDEIQVIAVKADSPSPERQKVNQETNKSKNAEVDQLAQGVRVLTPAAKKKKQTPWVKKPKKQFFPTPKQIANAATTSSARLLDPSEKPTTSKSVHTTKQQKSFLERLRNNDNGAQPFFSAPPVSSVSFKFSPSKLNTKPPNQQNRPNLRPNQPQNLLPSMADPDFQPGVQFFKSPLCAEYNKAIAGHQLNTQQIAPCQDTSFSQQPTKPPQVNFSFQQPTRPQEQRPRVPQNQETRVPRHRRPPIPQQPTMDLHRCRPLLSITHSSSNSTSINRAGFSLSICTFNVLCEGTKLRCMYLYPEIQQRISWKARWELLKNEIGAINAAIYCLQEVQYEHYVECFEPFFNRVNFKCYHTRRGGISNIDGCMLAYRKDLFTELKFEHVFFNYDVDNFNKDNVGQIILLQENSTKLVFLVANTHILFNMKRGEIKAGQIALLLATIDRYVQQLSKTDNFAGVLLCGDFNIDPFSPLYHFIRDGALQISQFARDLLAFDTNKRLTSNFPGSSFNVPTKVPLDPNTCKFLPDGGSKRCILTVDALQHDQRFLSAYRHVTADMELEVSTRHTQHACPDFIFYTGQQQAPHGETSESRIMIRKLLILPSLKTIDNVCGKMPNNQCGSDHLPLMAEFFIC